MPICLIVDADAGGCRTASTALDKVSAGIDSSAGQIRKAKDTSESEWEKGDAGDGFRRDSGAFANEIDRISDCATRASRHLSQFADQIDTVRVRMLEAAELAMSAGLAVDLGSGRPVWIFDPPPLYGPKPSLAAEAAHARQADAYQAAYRKVGEARRIEIDAYQALTKGVGDEGSLISQLTDSFVKDLPWTAAGFVSGVVGEGVKAHAKWSRIAAEYDEVMENMRRFAVDGVGDNEQIVKAFLNLPEGAADATKIAAANGMLALGHPESRVAQVLSSEFDLGPKLGAFGKIPYAGVFLTGAEIYLESRDAESAAEVAQITAKTSAGFIAGGAATTFLLSNPVGWSLLPAAALGGLVGWGVGEGVDWATK